MNYREQAEKIYEQTRPNPQAVAMGFPATPIQQATVDEIEAHLVLVAEVGEEYGVRLDAARVEFGATREQIAEIADARACRNRRSAGARALSRKYGKEAAERIIREKSGRSVTLRR
jgi:hypothetical protein